MEKAGKREEFETWFCTFEQSEKLERLGVKRPSRFVWIVYDGVPELSEHDMDEDYINYDSDIFRAYADRELDLMLPEFVLRKRFTKTSRKMKFDVKVNLADAKNDPAWKHMHFKQIHENGVVAKTSMLIILLSERHLSIEKVNGSLRADSE